MVVTENWATRDKCLYHLGEAHLVSLGGFWVRSGVSSRQVALTKDGTTARTLGATRPLACDVTEWRSPVVVLRVAAPEFDLLIGRPGELRP